MGCRIVFCGNKNDFFLFQVRMMDVEKCGTQDTNSKKQNGKNISRDREVEGKGNKKLKR